MKRPILSLLCVLILLSGILMPAAAVDILDHTAVEDMISGEYDLTLFTCTYGGENRVTVRCDRVVE